MKTLLHVLILFFIANLGFGQGVLKKSVSSVESGFIGSTSAYNNFNFRSLQYGEVPLKANLLTLRLNLHKDYDTLNLINKKYQAFNYGYGFRTAINVQQQSELKLTESFVKLRYKDFEFYAGRRREIFGLVDSTQSSGSYIWSGNALPMPKIQIHTPGYRPFFKSKYLSYKFGISHGWFGKERFVQNHFLHQKWLYGKLGGSKFSVQLGLNHQTMWGGYSEALKSITGPYPPTINGYLAPYPWYSYQYVVLPFLQKIKPPDPKKVPGYDGGLAIGNQLGSIDLALEWKIGNNGFLLYKQQPYDFARSIKNLNNIQDGNHGITLTLSKFKKIHQINFEFLDTRSQGLSRFGKNTSASNFGEYDDYFFHGQYQNWAYKKQILGTPYITSYYLDSLSKFNNRIKLFHLALKGELFKCHYSLKINHSQNLGVHSFIQKFSLFNTSFQVSKFVSKNALLETALAYDHQELFSKGFGFKINYIYYFYSLF